jgi:acetyl-CoA carboxylase carboxyltransferase component
MSKVLFAKIERDFGIEKSKFDSMTDDDLDPINTFMEELAYDVDELIKKRVDESQFKEVLII